MNLTDGEKLKLLCGMPLTYKDVCLIYSPCITEIAAMGLENFYACISILLTTKPAGEDGEIKQVLDKLSDFEYLLLITQLDPNNKKMLTKALELFTKDNSIIVLDNAEIILGDISEKRILNKDNFYDFQSYIGAVCAMEDFTSERIEFLESDTPQVRALKQQMLEGRKKREQAKQKEAKKKKSGGKIEFTDLLASVPIGSNGSYRLVDMQHMTYYAFQDQLKRMGWYEEFNINSRAAMAGAKISKDKLAHWIKNMTFN